MKNKSIFLILSIFILFAFSQSVMALDDNSTDVNIEESLEINSDTAISNNELNLNSTDPLTSNQSSEPLTPKIPTGVSINTSTFSKTEVDSSTNKSSLTLQNDTIYYGNQAQYLLKDIDGNPIPNAKVTISINGMNYDKTTDDNGIAKLTVRLISDKKYNITASYKGDSQTPAMFSKNVLTLLPTITASDVKKIFRNETQYYPKLTDSNGNVLKDTKVTMNINGMLYTKTTNDKGIATLSINLNPGKYIITSTNTKTGESISNSIIVDANMDQNSDLVKYFQNESQYSVRTLDNQGNPLANQNVTFNINGVFYTKTSNDKGIATQNINLNPGKYIITAMYKDCAVSNNITVLPVLTSDDLTKYFGIPAALTATLIDGKGNPLANENVTYNINGVFYNRVTDKNGTSKLNINLNPGEYIATISYKAAITSAKVVVLDMQIVKENATNTEIQNIINSIGGKGIIKFAGKVYSNISLDITKSIILTSEVNTTLNGKLNSNVLNIKADNVLVKNLNINGNNASGIVVDNVKNTVIENNNINNTLDKSKMKKYESGEILLPEKGIELLNSTNTTIENNSIKYYFNGIYLNGAKYTTIKNNTIIKNNFGVEFDKGVSNTLINNNDINENIGYHTLAVIEGPNGYGISIRHSGVNITATNNRINNNYMGVFIDAKNCTGIVIRSNEISNSTIEGLTVNENYTYAPGAVLIVENNAIYNNAKGPSQIILGEISANPNGIYGPGEWNDTLKLHLGANWYGTNTYTKWGENTTGPGTICPRINTTLIGYNISYISAGKYEVTFYNNGSLANELPDLTTYFVLNYKTDKEEVLKVVAHKGKATIEFSAKNYYQTKNTINGFSLFDPGIPKKIIYTYDVPDSEIPV